MLWNKKLLTIIAALIIAGPAVAQSEQFDRPQPMMDCKNWTTSFSRASKHNYAEGYRAGRTVGSGSKKFDPVIRSDTYEWIR
jgi:hypothetical protein